MVDPFTQTRFHPDLKLETWYPEGVLDGPKAAIILHHFGFAERIADEPFNRFTDFTKLTAIHLDFSEISDIAAERRASYEGQPPVKSAFFATAPAIYGVARMFAALMELSPIDVQVFSEIEEAAQWLRVPVAALRAEA